MADAVRLKGYRELLRASDRAEKDARREVRSEFREVGEIVRVDAHSRLRELSETSAEGLRTRVRQRGVAVEQSLRRTTGNRPDWGETQMRDVLVPALEDNQEEIDDRLEEALDRVADRFERS